MPISGTVGQLVNRLVSAGVGQRPVVFVSHRWGLSLSAQMFQRDHFWGPLPGLFTSAARCRICSQFN